MSERLDFSRMADRWRGHPSPIQDEPAVLLRDTDEDRERFIQIVRDTRIPMDGPYLDAVRDYAESLIAALRGER